MNDKKKGRLATAIFLIANLAIVALLVHCFGCGHTVFEQPPPPEPCRWECSKFCCVEICDPDSVWNEVCP